MSGMDRQGIALTVVALPIGGYVGSNLISSEPSWMAWTLGAVAGGGLVQAYWYFFMSAPAGSVGQISGLGRDGKLPFVEPKQLNMA